MSVFSKFLLPITIDADNGEFGYWDAGSNPTQVHITAGSYSSILSVMGNLAYQMVTQDGGDVTITVSEFGKISIEWDQYWEFHTTLTHDDCKDLIGSDGTESTVGWALTFTDQHKYGYYPGCLTYGYASNKGSGVAEDSRWIPNWPMVRQYAGNGAIRVVGPANPRYSRDLQFGLISQTELEDYDRGVTGFWNQAIASTFRWYPDRTLGTVSSPGTQNEDYYLCSLERDLRVRVHATSGEYYTVSMRLNKEPS